MARLIRGRRWGVSEQPKLRGDHHERWEHIARELGDYDLVDGTSAFNPWREMRREESDLCVGEWVEAEAAGKAIEARDKRIAELEAQKDGAYRERDRLVALLSKVFPSCLFRNPDEDTEWDDDWRWIVCIDFPTGQASWHIHDSERPWFDHLEVVENRWDGHSTEEKHRRIEKVVAVDLDGQDVSANNAQSVIDGLKDRVRKLLDERDALRGLLCECDIYLRIHASQNNGLKRDVQRVIDEWRKEVERG
jgi:hypothetical protein